MNAKCAKTVGYWMEENHAQTASSRPIKREGGMMKRIVEQEILDTVTKLEERRQRVWVMRSYSPKNPLVWYWRWRGRRERKKMEAILGKARGE